MRVLVTGGAGYVGSHTVRALCDAGFDVVVYDNLSTGHAAAVDRRASLIVGDLSNASHLTETLSRGIEAVLHFAASLDVNESVREPLRYYRNNVANTVTLLTSMKLAGVRKIVFSSTCATYGMPPFVPIDEDAPQQPINPYGRTKLAIEWMLRDSARAWNLGSTALRYFNAAGASPAGDIGEDHHPEIHLIPRVLLAAMGQLAEISIYGTDYPTPDGTCIRDYIHVDDLADAHVRALATQSEGTFRCFNLGTGRGASVRQIIDAAREVTGCDFPVVTSPRREGDPPKLIASPTRAHGELGWIPQYTEIGEIIRTAWNWHRTHPNGFASK
jgi:UDP-glucose 4-epimerase